MRTINRLILLTLCALSLGVGLWSEVASAHNSLESSSPAAGSTLEVAPASISMVFDKSVPLDTVSAALVDSTGTRTDLTDLTHGPTGDKEVIAALPVLPVGEVTVRWRLVGADGHPLTGRITFTIAPPAPTAVAVPSPSIQAAPPASGSPPAVDVNSASDLDEPFSVPDPLRWFLRFGAYLAIAALVGIVLTDQFVWPGSASTPGLRRIVSVALGATAVLSLAQLLVLASDISGRPLLSAWSSIDPALETSAGVALAIRIILVAVAYLVLYRMDIVHNDVRWTAVGLVGVLLMGTWAWAGHSLSQRWSLVGVPVDVVHHSSAALWLGALGIVGFIGTRSLSGAEFVQTVHRLSRVAAISVALIIGTGVIQSIRLVGGPARLFEADHGRYLVAKLVLLAIMLAVANLNRRRLSTGEGAGLGRTIVIELAIGLAIIGVTAALVVSPPATA